MTFEKAFITKKLEQITGYTKELDELMREIGNNEALSQRNLHVAERLVQLIVDAMIDINQHFIREKDLEVPDDLRGTFAIMGESGILPKEFSDRIAPLAGLRNILVHQYEELNTDLFMKSLRNNFSDFEKYQKYIYEYLKKE
ncbi:MAG: DUF86 domain-containing protein [Candidatus Wildermuthbacteria bacterium]|nr:DUF86 domain-containing protein [Candidatus Wildermuthbacteria bacterium]